MRARTSLITVVLLAAPVWASAQEEEKKLGWADTAEVSFVTTGGNADATTLGLRNTLTRTWEEAVLTIEAAALRASTGAITRTAVGSGVDDFDVATSSDSRLTAENYLARGRYDRELNGRLYWFAGSGWERNVFAGIQNRFEGIGGVGHVWFDEEARKLRTSYGLSIVHQEDVIQNDEVSETFAALRLSSDYMRKLTDTTSYTNKLIANQSLQETKDFRFDLINALSVSLSDSLALKLTYQVLFDNLPSLETLPLQSPSGVPLGVTVLAPLERFDTVFNLALVVAF